jgi:type IV secretion system protein VirD4
MERTDIKNKEMKYLQKLSSEKFTIIIVSIVLMITTLLCNLITNTLIFSLDKFKGDNAEYSFFINLFKFKFFSFPIVYLIAYSFAGVVLVKLIFNLKASYCTISEGQKGTSRFTTREEIEQQYKAIPEKTLIYEGKGGVPISRYKDKIFIDDSPVNTLVIGTTRSGKGETFVFPTIDIYSRAEEKASMIINDPKGELIAASKETLENREYRVEMLNLLNPLNSMSYNPLQLIIDAYEGKRYSEAQSLCKTLTYTLYYKPSAKDPFWQNSAMSLVNALILAVIDEVEKRCEEIDKEIARETHEGRIKTLYIEKDKEKAKRTLYTVANMLSELGSKEDEFGNNELDKYFSNLEASSPAKMQYATSKFADGSTRGGIFATAMTELQIFTLDEIAKMTSMNSISLKDVGFRNENDPRPVAIFMVTPDYDASNHVISSIFVRQLYYVLAKESSLSAKGKCDREVIFLLDEFGNMPAIEGMANIITVCLGRGIRFIMIIQAYSQLKKLYADDDKTIIGNCGNQIYILTNEDETAETFSKLLGDKTIELYSRSGEIMDITKHQTESVDGRRLLTSAELRSLKEGESVISRVIKRADLNRNKIVPYPIFNTGETCMKYRYEYLGEDFDNSKSLSTIQVNSLHNDINLKELIMFNDENKNKDELIKQDKTQEENKILSQVYSPDEIEEIKSIVRKYLNTSVRIDMNMSIEKFEKFVSDEDNEKLNSYLKECKSRQVS